MKSNYFLNLMKTVTATVIFFSVITQCSDDELKLKPTAAVAEDLTTTATAVGCATCTYVVPENAYLIDGKALGLKPGNIIGLNAAFKYKNIVFRNIVGTATNPIIIKNFGGTVNVDVTGISFGIKTELSKYFRITGGDTKGLYGIKITGGQLSLTLDRLSTNFEVDHVEISNSGFSGLMAKTDPSCDNATIRGNFLMQDVSIHDNYVHDTGGEAFYVGNSFYDSGVKTSCGLRFPHEIHNLKLFNNIVKNSGWESIQVGSATVGAQVYGNVIENYATKNSQSQNNGVQLGAGTGGLFYDNYIKSGTGNALIVLGLGDNLIYNNIIVNAGAAGIFCDERFTPGPGFKFVNNTIVNPKTDGIRIYADLVPMNVIINNTIVNPGSYSTYVYPRKGDDAYIYKLSSNVKIQLSNNYFTRDINAVKFASYSANNYRLTSASPLVNKGTSILAYSIAKDFYQQLRLKGSAYDIGASEY